MKKRNRILGAVGGVVFGAVVVTFLVAFVIYFGKELLFGINFIDALKRLELLFDFQQTQINVLTQFATLAIFGVGAIWGIVWLVLGACKKHLIEILFFLGTCVAFFFFGLVMMYHGEAIIENFKVDPIDGKTIGRLIILPIVCLFLLAGLIVTFCLDMKRIYAPDDPVFFDEPTQYAQETLFREMFGEEKAPANVEAQKDADEARVKAVMAQVDARIYEEQILATLPVAEEEVPEILRKVEEEPKEEVYEHLPILDKPMPEDVQKAEEPIEIPDILKTESELEKEGKSSKEELPPFMIPGFIKKEEPEEPVELPPFMKEGFVKKAEKTESEKTSPIFKKVTGHSSKAYHISRNENGYQVKEAGSSESLGSFDSEESAVNFIRSVTPDASIRIHDKNGKIRSI